MSLTNVNFESNEFLTHYADDEYSVYDSFPNTIFVNPVVFNKIKNAPTHKELFAILNSLTKRRDDDGAKI